MNFCYLPCRLCFLLLVFVATACGVVPPDLTADYTFAVNLTQYTRTNLLQDPRYFVLYYSVQSTTIDIGLVCDTGATGWCAFGFSPDGTSINSDVVVGWVDVNNTAFMTGLLIHAKIAPNRTLCEVSTTEDLAQCICPDADIENCDDNTIGDTGYRTGNYLTIRYSRPLIASDACDKAVKNTTNFLVFAVGGVCTNCTSFPYNIVTETHHSPSSISINLKTAALSLSSSSTTGSGLNTDTNGNGTFTGADSSSSESVLRAKVEPYLTAAALVIFFVGIVVALAIFFKKQGAR